MRWGKRVIAALGYGQVPAINGLYVNGKLLKESSGDKSVTDVSSRCALFDSGTTHRDEYR